jgi:Kef-type K+ transport system membrane component KefB
MPQHLVATVLADIALIVLVARLLGALMERIGQPSVVGEILAGVVLGPTLLGAIPGDPSAFLFPADARPYLSVLGQVGLVLFMFVVGLELDLGLLRRRRAVVAAGTGSVVLPFALGLLLAPLLWDRYHPAAGVSATAFALFSGVALAITAFPVLARILMDRGLIATELGALGLACAAFNDLVGWVVLAVVLAVVSSGGAGGVALAIGGTAGLAAVLLAVVRPFVLPELARRRIRAGRLTPELLAAGLVLMFAAAWATERAGTHLIFGAFLVGAVWPRDAGAPVGEEIRAQVEPLTRRLLLPLFFAVPGFSVNLRAIDADGLGLLALILVAAIGGKLLGATLGARAGGLAWRSAGTLGTLMNTRGLTELIVLNIGLASGVLTPELYTLLVVMAVVTTMMTGPILGRLRPSGQVELAGAAAGRREPEEGATG